MSSAENVIADPVISGLRKEWVDAYTRHLLGNYVKPPWDAANVLRASAGLTALAPSDLADDASKGVLAPRILVPDVVNLRLQAKQGYKSLDIAAEAPSQPAAPAQFY